MGLFLMTLLSFFATGQEGSLEEGRMLYENEQFEEAVSFYKQKLSEGMVSYEVHYNLGTAHLANGDVGEGIFHLETSLRMHDDPEVREQLEVAQGLIQDDIPYFSDFFLLRWLRGVAQVPGSNFWAILSLLIFIGLLTLMYLRWVKGQHLNRWSYIWASLLGFSLLSLFISFQARQLDKSRILAIVLEETSLHEGSDERSDVVRSVSEGIKVRVVDEIDGWQKVELPDKEVGWIKGDDLGVLK
jgi:hypothetical protein